MVNREHFDRFVSYVFDPVTIDGQGCVELVAWSAYLNPKNGLVCRASFPVTIAGWFDKASALRAAAGKFHGVSAYATFNPVNRDRLSQSNNQVVKVGKGEGTKEEDIIQIKYFMIDIDVQRSSSKISSNQSELNSGIELRDRILDGEPGIRSNAIWGCSGNSGYILVKIDPLPNEKKTKETVRKQLLRLADKYGKKGRDAAYVDVNPHFANAHLPLPGTQKCKGDSTEERPWRTVTVDGGF
jgi:hypothetical protein